MHPEEPLEDLIDSHALKATVLVLDDQAVIRKILATILLKLGIDVTFTVEGNETVEAYRKRLEEDRPFDAVILDLTIPGGMGGKEASEKILAMDPQAKIIISSGYASDPIMSHYKDYGIKGIAVKPYRFSDFKEILLRVLLGR
jgi:CheY-like chemotaxis protein